MATITVNPYYLDSNAAVAAGETMTINGGRLFIRTDTRWHAQAPASMNGSLGAITISSTLGGGCEIDGTKVRWMAFTGGSGTVPAIGTNITQSGKVTSSYLLGVYASITSAPTAVAAAMPATGFIKFREVTGTFGAGALTGITATASGPDVVGWIEVVRDNSTSITVPRLGDLKVRGAWFDLGTTTGVANQVVQLPTNGSATAYIPGLWIETAVADTYEFYPAVFVAGMTTTNFGTDARSKFVSMETNGSCRIGHNGTTAVCYVPPAGRKIRVPNIFGRAAVTTTRSANAIPNATFGTRPSITTTNAGVIDIDTMASDWYFNFNQAYSVKIKNSSTWDAVGVSEIPTSFEITNCGVGFSQSVGIKSLSIASCTVGGTVTDGWFPRYSAAGLVHAVEIVTSSNINLTRVSAGVATFARSTGMSFQVTQSSNINLFDCYAINQGLQFTTSTNCTVDQYDYCDRYLGSTDTTGIYSTTIQTNSDNILIKNVTLGLKGQIANVHPYLGIFLVVQSSNIKIRNIGTRSARLNGGTVNNPAYIIASTGGNSKCKYQQIYMQPTRTAAWQTNNTDTNMTYEHVYGDFIDVLTVDQLNTQVKNCGATLTTTGQAAVYGTHFLSLFTSDTTGSVILACNEPTASTSQYITIVAGTPKFTSAGNVTMQTVGDEVIFEMSSMVLGATGFSASNATITGTNVTFSSGSRWGNHDIYYQIDTGSGYNGTWKNFNGATLSTETITPSTGFKLKIRIVCAIASTTNLITYINTGLVSTLVAQTNNLYLLDTVTTTISAGTLPLTGAEIRVYDMDNVPAGSLGTELAGVESASSSTFSFSTTPSNTIWIQIMLNGYKEFGTSTVTGTVDGTYSVALTADPDI